MPRGLATRRVLPAVVVLVAVVLAEGAGAAVTTVDQYGTALIDGQKVFPIVLAKGPERGSTTQTGGDAVDEVVAAGVNVFKVGPATRPWWPEDKADAEAWNQEAAARGVYTWVNLATLADAEPGKLKDTRLREVIALLENDPALAMWKGADEPWLARFAPEELQYAYCVATSRGEAGWCQAPADQEHPWVTIQAPRGTSADLEPYSAVTDIHGVDHYPVTWVDQNDPNLHEVGVWTDTIASVTPNRAVWTTLQVCASGSSGPNEGEFVLPTRRQERYMIYDAILNGARSLAFYGGNIDRCWTPADAALSWNWSFWNDVLKGLIQEISADSPIAPALVNPGSTQGAGQHRRDDAGDQPRRHRRRALGDRGPSRCGIGAGDHQQSPVDRERMGRCTPRDARSRQPVARSRTPSPSGTSTCIDSTSRHLRRRLLRPRLPPPASPPPPPAPMPPPAPRLTRDTTPPNTRLTASPSRRTRVHRARFRFASTEAGSRFQCKLDRRPWTACRSPLAYTRLKKGLHVFRVRARDAAGNADPTPAARSWRIR